MISKHISDIPARSDSSYPEPFRSRVLPREKRSLGDAFGLAAFGVNHTVLAPGKESSMRHWHTHEDELIVMLEGELVLVTELGEETLTPGMVVGFRAGDPNAHQLVNRGLLPAVYLEIGGRDSADTAHYADVDLHCEAAGQGGYRFSRRDGTPY